MAAQFLTGANSRFARRGFLALAGGALLTLSGCVKGSEQDLAAALTEPLASGAPDPDTSLKIAGRTTQLQIEAAGAEIGQLQFTVAEWVNVSAGPDVIQAFRADAVDVASNAGIPPIQARDIKVDTKIVAVLERPKPTYIFATAPGTNINSFADFKGKKLAFSQGQAQGVVLLRTLDTAGIAYDDVELIELPSPQFLTALQGKQVDVAVLGEPALTKYIDKYRRDGAKAIPANELDLLTVLWTPTENLSDDNKVRAIRNYIEVWAKGSVWAWENQEEWIQKYYIDSEGVSREDADRIIKTVNKPLFPKQWDAAVDWEQKTADLLAKGGFVRSFDVETLFDRRFETVAADVVPAEYTR